MTTPAELKQMFLRGKAKPGCTHMIVVCDTFSQKDYPVYVMEGKDVRDVEKEYDGKNMQRVMEVYSMSLPMEEQLAQPRAFNY